MSDDVEIAVVGAGCRFPDAWTPQQYWSNIDNGVVSMRELSDEQLRAGGVAEEVLRAPGYVRIGTVLPGVAEFAADFFGYSPREARLMDPQQRIFLECCWEALEFAGHPPAADGPLVGVFAGSAAGTYSAAMLALAVNRVGLAEAVDDIDITTGGEPDYLTSRVAYKLGLRGPAVSVQAACSSSLYAVHFASLSLLSGECDVALAGGATVLEPVRGYRYRPDGGQSEDGYCRAFDIRSSGTTYSSGVGVVALRRLADALADGDPILAVLRGTAVGNDGALKAGYAAPSPAGVADVVTAALRVADVPAETVRYAEAHGTATPLGDHVELTALTTALRTGTAPTGYCALGSVKANIGHTGSAASIAGFLKGVHIARTGSIPPHPTFERPRDPGILAESPFYITTAARSCTDPDRHVLVNSIAFGGANAAAVLGPPPSPTRPAAPARDLVRLVVSARNRIELDRLSNALADELDRDPAAVADIAHTLRVGRHAFDERRVVTAAPDRLATAMRLPRPPLARSARSTARRAVIGVPDGVEVPAGLLDRLRAALPDRTAVVGDPAGYAPPEWFRIVLGGGPDGPDRHILALDEGPPALADRLEAAVAAAWLHGVPVDWECLTGGRGHRVPLPTYPFQRKRHWALDDVPPVDLAGAAARRDRPTAAAPVPSTAGSDDGHSDGGGSVEAGVLAVWRELFGDAAIGLDDEFGARGGTSLLSVQIVLELQERYGVVLNVHRAGGTRATPRRMAEMIRVQHGDPDQEGFRVDRLHTDDTPLIDADLQLPLGRLAPTPAPGTDILFTGATGFLGAHLLHELLTATTGRVYCMVRAADEAAGLARLRNAAARFLLPEPDPSRVYPVPGDLRDIARVAPAYRHGELERRIGHVVHAAARVVVTEPYRTLREDNVLPMAALLTWVRGCGIGDFTLVSTAAATGPAVGSSWVLETRDQPLDPRDGGYGASKWVGERLLERAEADGMRVRVFRPGLIMSASRTGAGNEKDLVYIVLASGVAVGAHPVDDGLHIMAPVDVVARAIAELALARGSVGRVYHLFPEDPVRMCDLFAMLGDAGLPTRPVPLKEWQELVRDRALATGDPILATGALLELEGTGPDEPPTQARGWQPWLRRTGTDPRVTGGMLRGGLAYLARSSPMFGALLPDLATALTAEVPE